jgi:hypothetical protein
MLGQSDRQRDRALDEPLSGTADGREGAPSGGRRRDPCAARTDLSRASITIRQGLGLLPPATPLREPDCDVDDGAEQDDPKPIGRRVAPFARIEPHAEALAVPIRSGAHPERLEEYHALTEATIKVKTPHLRRFHGASRTRAGDLLGAISALAWPEFGLTSCFPSPQASYPNTFPSTLQPVLQGRVLGSVVARPFHHVHYRETEHLRVLIANERRDRLALVAPIVAALGHEVIAREIEVEDVGAVTARERPDVALVGLGENWSTRSTSLRGSFARRLARSSFSSTRPIRHSSKRRPSGAFSPISRMPTPRTGRARSTSCYDASRSTTTSKAPSAVGPRSSARKGS